MVGRTIAEPLPNGQNDNGCYQVSLVCIDAEVEPIPTKFKEKEQQKVNEYFKMIPRGVARVE